MRLFASQRPRPLRVMALLYSVVAIEYLLALSLVMTSDVSRVGAESPSLQSRAAPAIESAATASPSSSTPTTLNPQSTPVHTSTLQPAVPYTCAVAPYGMPGEIRLFTAAEGVTKQIDTPVYYTTSTAATMSAIDTNIARCAQQQPLLHGYHAVTSYWIGSTYYSEKVTDTTCRLTGIKVAVHINQLLPRVNHDTSTPASVVAAWDQQAAQLAQHENEHVGITTGRADMLYSQLQQLSGDCGSILETARSIVTQNDHAIAHANQTLDDQTSHGQNL